MNTNGSKLNPSPGVGGFDKQSVQNVIRKVEKADENSNDLRERMKREQRFVVAVRFA